MTKQFRGMLMAALAMAATMGSAHADPVEITFTGFADFQLGEEIFEDAAFTIRTAADTANVLRTTVPNTTIRVLQYQGLPATLFVDGLGDGKLTYNVSVFSNPVGQIAGLMASVNFIPFHSVFDMVDMFGLKSPVLATYDLKSDLRLEDAEFYDPQQWYELDTSFGKLTATGFQSVKMDVKVTPVPEASSGMLFALGGGLLMGAGASRRRPSRV